MSEINFSAAIANIQAAKQAMLKTVTVTNNPTATLGLANLRTITPERINSILQGASLKNFSTTAEGRRLFALNKGEQTYGVLGQSPTTINYDKDAHHKLRGLFNANGFNKQQLLQLKSGLPSEFSAKNLTINEKINEKISEGIAKANTKIGELNAKIEELKKFDVKGEINAEVEKLKAKIEELKNLDVKEELKAEIEKIKNADYSHTVRKEIDEEYYRQFGENGPIVYGSVKGNGQLDVNYNRNDGFSHALDGQFVAQGGIISYENRFEGTIGNNTTYNGHVRGPSIYGTVGYGDTGLHVGITAIALEASANIEYQKGNISAQAEANLKLLEVQAGISDGAVAYKFTPILVSANAEVTHSKGGVETTAGASIGVGLSVGGSGGVISEDKDGDGLKERGFELSVGAGILDLSIKFETEAIDKAAEDIKEEIDRAKDSIGKEIDRADR